MHADPYPWYRHMALHRPFHRDAGIGLWVAAGPAEVDAVLRHPALRVRPPAEPVPQALAGTRAGALYGGWARMNDGAVHASLKGPLQQALAAVDLARAHAVARDFVDRLADDRGAADLANEAMLAVPVLTVASLLGLTAPASGTRGTVAGPGIDTNIPTTVATVATVTTDIATDIAADIARFARAMSPLADAPTIAAGIAAARRSADAVANAAGSPWSRLLQAQWRAAGLTDDIVTANLLGLMIQSCEATAGLIGNVLLALARDTGNGDTPLPARIARVLHVDPPIHNTRRFVADDAVVCGTPLRSGDVVLVLLAAAAAAAARPAPSGTSPTFGAGAHRCPGQALAAVLADATIAGLLARGVQPVQLARRYRYRPSLNARMPEFL